MKKEHIILSGACVVVAGIAGFTVGRWVGRKETVRAIQTHEKKKKVGPSLSKKGPIITGCPYEVVRETVSA